MKQQEASKKWGQFAEQAAVDFLVEHGYVIRERNWRPKHGHLEVDIISQQGNAIVFVEVKARNDKGIDPIEAVDSRKRIKLCRAAEIYLGLMAADMEYRFDIITVTGSEQDYEIDHIPDAFLPPLSSR